MTIPVRVVVQDRRRLLREGLADLLAAEPEIVVVAVVADAGELPGDLGRPDVVLLSASDEPGPCTGKGVVRFTGCEPAGSLVEAVRAAAPPVAPARSVQDTAATPGPRLTSRETQVARRMAEGMSTGQIAMTLGIAWKSVDNHKQRIFVKLGAQNGAHAVALALEAELLGSVDESRRGLAG